MHNTPTLTPEQNEASRAHYANELAKMRGDANRQTANEAELFANFAAVLGISVNTARKMHGMFRGIKPIQ